MIDIDDIKDLFGQIPTENRSHGRPDNKTDIRLSRS